MKVAESASRLTLFLALTMATQALLGIVFSGEYRDVAWIASTWWGNDLVTLVLGAPLLVLGLGLARGGSPRGLLLWIGMLAYAVYNYAYYLLGAALNRFFALYVVLAVTSAAALIMALTGIDPAAVAAQFRAKTPVRVLGGYFMFVAFGLSVIWLATWAAFAFASKPTPVETEAFKLVAALDMGFMVPVLALGGYWLLRRRAWGYTVAAFGGLQASLYLLVLSVNSVFAIQRGLAEWPGELTTWGPLLIATGTATAVLFGNIESKAERVAE